jgi:alkylhydroperoxidase family enzyme
MRLRAVSAWRESPSVSAAERAALALAEAVTRLSDQSDPVPDPVWEEAARHHGEAALVHLVVAIAVTNLWNHLNVATREPAGEWSTSRCA